MQTKDQQSSSGLLTVIFFFPLTWAHHYRIYQNYKPKPKEQKGKKKKKKDIYKGNWCEWKGNELADWGFYVKSGLGFQLQCCQHSPNIMSREEWGSPLQNRSWRQCLCQNHSDITTPGPCEHDTGTCCKTACRTNSVTTQAIWNECTHPTSPDLVDPSPYSRQV